MKIRQEYEYLLTENERLKIIENQFRQEIEGKDLAIRSLLRKINNKDGDFTKLKGQKHLTIALKKQIRVLREELKSKNAKIDFINRNPKITKIGELEIEQQIITDEIIRLKEMLDQIKNQRMGGYSENEIEQMAETVHKQSVLISSIKDEHKKFITMINNRQQTHNQIKNYIVQLTKDINKLKSKNEENTKERKDFKRISRESKKLKDQLSFIKSLPKNSQQVEYQQRIKELLKKQEEATDNLNEKTKILEDLESKATSTKTKIEKYKKEASDLTKKINEYENKLETERKSMQDELPIVKREEIQKIVWVIKMALIEQGISNNNIRSVWFYINIVGIF